MRIPQKRNITVGNRNIDKTEYRIIERFRYRAVDTRNREYAVLN